MLVQLLSVAGRGLREGSHNRNLGDGILDVKAKHNYGADIDVSFEYPTARAWPPPEDTERTILIFQDTKEGLPLDEYPEDATLLGFLYDCNSQDEDGCEPQESGSVTFSAEDPKSYYTYYSEGSEDPIRFGNYIVCYAELTYEDGDCMAEELLADCKKIKVKPIKKKVINGATIAPKKNKRKQGEIIQVSFKTKHPIVNQWIGLFPEENGGPPESPLDDKDVIWNYTGCKDHTGDQKESSNCIKKKKKGTVKMGEQEVVEGFGMWPLAVGKYYPCLVWVADTPYDKFLCAEDPIVVVSKE